MIKQCTTAILCLAAVAAMGQATAPSPTGSSAAKPAAPHPLKLYLMDGSLVTGKISVSELTVDTDFGTLKVPIESIKSFSPGLASHPELEKKLNDLIGDLGADGFAEREKAQQELLKMGPQISPVLRRQLKTAEAEKQTRLQKILEEFDSERDSDDEPETAPTDWSRDDTIVTNSFTIVGHITTPGFAVTNAYGTLQLKLADVRRGARDAAEVEEIRKTVNVSGNLINSHTYETALKVNKGDVISLTATGTVTLSPWGGNATSSPDGSPNYGSMGNIPTGALVARIGNGTVFKAGSKTTFTADKTGVLQFSIAIPGNYSGNEFPGEYQVKLRVTPHK